MLKVAISGNIASGKSTVEKILENLGYAVFDTDKIAHEIISKSLEIREAFKDFDIIKNDQIDRKKLGQVVFSDSEKMKSLEAIVHPLVKKELENIFRKDFDIVFVSVPQLFEAGFEKMFDKIIYVATDESIRLKRLMKRNNLTESEANLRIKAQLSDSEKAKKSDFIINNDGNLKSLNDSIGQILEKLI